jgi:hypothetical protein
VGVNGIAMQNLSFSDLTETKAVTEFQLEPTVNPCSMEYRHMLQRQVSTDINKYHITEFSVPVQNEKSDSIHN